MVIISIYKRTSDGTRLFGCLCVCVYQILASFSSHCQYNESVYRKEEHASSFNTIPLKISNLLTLETLKWETFATDVFMKSLSLLSVTCRHCSVQL